MAKTLRAASTSSGMSFADVLRGCEDMRDVESWVRDLSEAELHAMLAHWPTKAHEIQHPPTGRTRRENPDWTIWLVLGGRGAGKTRTGAEWVRGMAMGEPGFAEPRFGRIALVAETFQAARDVMIEGPSGLLHLPGERPSWSPALRRLEFGSGAIAQVFSAEDPDSLRGPQFDAAWADELAKWRHVDETWDMLQFGLRLGFAPREIVTTTPRPLPLLKRFLTDPRVLLSRSRTRDNAKNLAPAFFDLVVGRYEGSRLGGQELDGELIESRPDALWSRELIELCRVQAAPELMRVVLAIDPPASSGPRADACGIVAAGIDEAGLGYVLADMSAAGLKPAEWAARAVAAYRRWGADALVAEANQGGEMVAAVLREVDPGVPVTLVHATRGKYVRAEPVAVLYEQGRVRHVGAFPELEDEMADFAASGLSSGRSPDRLDALVWALTQLMLQPRAEPRIRML